MSNQSRRPHWYYFLILFLLLGAYLIFDYRYQEGWHHWERLGPKFRYRWTKNLASVRIKTQGPVISIPVSAAHPKIERKPVKVELYIDGQFIDQIVLRHHKWQSFDYLLPDPEKEFIELKFKVNRLWNPLKTVGNKDDRNLGVAVGPFSWPEWKIGSMVGFYDQEIGDNGLPFRWTRKQASMMLAVRGRELTIPVQAVHPHMGRYPVKVEVFVDNVLWDTAILKKGGWWENLQYELPHPNKKTIQLTFNVDRTWSPLETKQSNDPRELGIAVGEITWGD